ncbi:MAG: hypothetical protein ACXIVQ_06755 [Acidimicrobiales bacterium]
MRRATLVLTVVVAMVLSGATLAGAVESDPTTTTSTTEPAPTTTTTTEPAPTTTTTAPPTTTTAPPTTTTAPTPTTTTSSPSTTVPTTTSTTQVNPLLVSGPSTGRRQIAGVESDVAADADGSEEEDAPGPVVADDAERRVRLVVAALIGVALLLTALAVYYWWLTRPDRLDEGPDEDDTVDPWQTDSTSTR